MENVIANHIKWIDFGLSIFNDGKIKTNLCGSVSYAAPEVYSRRYKGFASDIWSLTVCLFGMVLGFFPYQQANFDDWRFEKAYNSDAIVNKILSFYEKYGNYLVIVRTFYFGYSESKKINSLMKRLLISDFSLF